MQNFVNDYSEGAYPGILERLTETNFIKASGYGYDEYSISARERICEKIGNDEAEVYFLEGGTQTNAIAIAALLKSYEGVISVHTGHIAVHEAGAIEHLGHKVLSIEDKSGKLSADSLRTYMQEFERDVNNEHMVKPGMVYISFPTEYGSLYTKKELGDIKAVCEEYDLYFFIDGARLGYALAAEDNDVTYEDLGSIPDLFYIGGTKCGALFGEALVLNRRNMIPRFVSIIKQNGALLTKSRALGIQFDELFKGDTYINICKNAITQAMRIKKALVEKGYEIYIDSPTNQQFIKVSNKKMEELSKNIAFGYMEAAGEDASIIRLCTSWATRPEDVDELIRLL